MHNSDLDVNQEYLLQEQYKDGSIFAERGRIMQDLGIDLSTWYRQIFERIVLVPGSRVLELGCGPGYLWQNNLDRLPSDSEITLSDFSPGMLSAAQHTLGSQSQRFRFQVIDAQAIPFAAAHFDVVIANLMLYHVPDRPRAISEIARVLKPGGHFYAATFSQSVWSAHLDQLVRDAGIATWMMNSSHFSMENGAEQLAPYFSQVTLHPLKSQTMSMGAQPLVEFIRTGTAKADWDEAKFQHLHQLIEQTLVQDGPMTLTMGVGVFDGLV